MFNSTFLKYSFLLLWIKTLKSTDIFHSFFFFFLVIPWEKSSKYKLGTWTLGYKVCYFIQFRIENCIFSLYIQYTRVSFILLLHFVFLSISFSVFISYFSFFFFVRLFWCIFISIDFISFFISSSLQFYVYIFFSFLTFLLAHSLSLSLSFSWLVYLHAFACMPFLLCTTFSCSLFKSIICYLNDIFTVLCILVYVSLWCRTMRTWLSENKTEQNLYVGYRSAKGGQRRGRDKVKSIRMRRKKKEKKTNKCSNVSRFSFCFALILRYMLFNHKTFLFR